MKCSVSALMFATTVFVVAQARADDWPEFRGKAGQGAADGGGFPVEWSDSNNVAWKQSIPGKGWSSPIVSGGRIYLTTSVSEGQSSTNNQSLRALCLDATKGNILWDQEVFHQDGVKALRIHAKNSHASPTPLLSGDRLYAHFGHQGTACLDLAGKVLWFSTNVTYAPVHGNGGSPVVADDALVFCGDGEKQPFTAALDKNTGRLLWKTERNVKAAQLSSFSTPLVITVNGKKQVVSAGSGVVCAYDPPSGREIWRVRHDGYTTVPQPLFGNGLVFVCTGWAKPKLLAIRPDGEGDVTATHVIWACNNSVPQISSPLLIGDEIYMVSDNGKATCLDAKTGQICWQERINGNYSASPIYCEGKVYFQNEAGVGVVVKAGRSFEQLARNSLGEKALASYAAVDGALFIRTDKHLYCIKPKR